MKSIPTAVNPASSTPRLEAQLCFALYSTGLAMNKTYRKLLKPLDLTYPQYLVMMVLWEHENQSVSEIGQRLFLDSATLTPLLKRLEVGGLVVRQRSRDDERHVVISLSARGKALQAKAAKVQDAIMCAAQCTADAARALQTSLQELRGKLIHAE